MKKLTALSIIVSFLIFNVAYVSLSYAEEAVVEKIASEKAAKKLAVKAGGKYIEGASAPTMTGNQVALPVIDESTGEVTGYIVADQDKLVAVLNEEGYRDVASALAAAKTTAEAGEAAGLIAETGIAVGTIGKAAAAAAVVGGVAAAAGGGGGGGSTTTTHH